MTATITKIDSTVLDNLDFDPPCEIVFREDSDDCPRPARWVIHWIVCCLAHEDATPACDTHKDFILTYGGEGVCTNCGTKVMPYRKAVNRVEALGGDRG